MHHNPYIFPLRDNCIEVMFVKDKYHNSLSRFTKFYLLIRYDTKNYARSKKCYPGIRRIKLCKEVYLLVSL